VPAVACASAAPAEASPRSETKSEMGGARAGAGCALPKDLRRRCALFTGTKATWAGACIARLFSEGGGITGHHITFGRRGEKKRAVADGERQRPPVTVTVSCCCCLLSCCSSTLLPTRRFSVQAFNEKQVQKFQLCVSHKPQLTLVLGVEGRVVKV
jgi:hypothetical protein